MRAAELLSDLIELPLEMDREIDFLTDHSAHAKSNSIFVCVRGAKVDGHLYASSAYANGCRIFLAEHETELPKDATVILINNTRLACATLACKLYNHPSRRLRVIGITGTKGKTTVAQMIAHILNQNGVPTGYIGTNGIVYGETHLETVNTTPDPISLQGTLEQMCQASMQAAVIEVSSQALMQDRIAGICFDSVLFTNLFPDHIGIHEHPSFEHYQECKHRLFKEFEAQAAIYNADDPASNLMVRDSRANLRISCTSKGNRSFFCAENISFERNNGTLRTSFFCKGTDGARVRCDLPLIGSVNVDNALLAIACVNTRFGISVEDAARTLKTLFVSGRSEIIPLPNGADAVIDYAHNGDSLRQLLTSLRHYRPARLLCLFGSVGERTLQRRHELGRAAAELSDYCILTSDNPGLENPEQILTEIEEAFVSSETPYVKIVDRKEAILYALSKTRPGDILILAGKGHEDYQLIGKEKIPFSEREILYEFLNQMSAIQ